MIDGKVVRLRAITSADYGYLARLRSDEDLARLLTSRARASSSESIKPWVDRVTSDSNSLLFAIAHVDTDSVAGFLQVTQMDTVSGTAMFGICLGREAQGKGLGKEALTLVESYLPRVWRIRKLVLHVLASNDAAIGLYKTLGFQDVGVMKQHFWFDGEYNDVLIMEKLF